MRSAATLTTLACFIALGTISTIAAADEAELYTGLDETLLFEQCGIQVTHVEMGIQGCPGDMRRAQAMYWFGERATVRSGRESYPGRWTDYVAIAVYTTVEEAETAYRACSISSRGIAFAPPPGASIGDEAYWSYSEVGTEKRGVSVTCRRANVVVRVHRLQAASEAVALARQIDGLIQSSREIAPRGRFDPMPEILDPGIPNELMVRPMKVRMPPTGRERQGENARWHRPGGRHEDVAYVRISPEFRAAGEVDQLWIVVLPRGQDNGNMLLDMNGPHDRYFRTDWGSGYYVPIGAGQLRAVTREQAVADGVDGRLLMCVSVPVTSQTMKLTLFAVTDQNVILQRDVEVHLERADSTAR